MSMKLVSRRSTSKAEDFVLNGGRRVGWGSYTVTVGGTIPTSITAVPEETKFRMRCGMP